ncbi:hypothetical protein QFX71_003092 [Citrobacter amalonaticus]|nr:hypothetical protein [Citrobacter amalonaticus]
MLHFKSVFLLEMMMSNYILGREEPKPTADIGSGSWCRVGHFSNKLYYYKYYIEKVIDGNLFLKYKYPFAQRNLRHYLKNTGEDLHVNLSDMMKKSAQLKNNYIKELKAAKLFCQTLPPGEHFFTSSHVSRDDFITDNSDLFYAIGGYQYWGKGKVNIQENTYSSVLTNSDRLCDYFMQFQFVFFDRYNWNVGNKKFGVRLGNAVPVSDHFMGRFHQECLAREYNISGVIETEENWHD